MQLVELGEYQASSGSHNPVWFMIFSTSAKASNYAKLFLTLPKYSKTFVTFKIISNVTILRVNENFVTCPVQRKFCFHDSAITSFTPLCSFCLLPQRYSNHGSFHKYIEKKKKLLMNSLKKRDNIKFNIITYEKKKRKKNIQVLTNIKNIPNELIWIKVVFLTRIIIDYNWSGRNT